MLVVTAPCEIAANMLVFTAPYNHKTLEIASHILVVTAPYEIASHMLVITAPTII